MHKSSTSLAIATLFLFLRVPTISTTDLTTLVSKSNSTAASTPTTIGAYTIIINPVQQQTSTAAITLPSGGTTTGRTTDKSSGRTTAASTPTTTGAYTIIINPVPAVITTPISSTTAAVYTTIIHPVASLSVLASNAQNALGSQALFVSWAAPSGGGIVTYNVSWNISSSYDCPHLHSNSH